MNLNEALALIKNTNNAAIPIYIPVLGRDVLFHPLLTGDQKILAKISIGVSEYDADLMRMALFEKMLVETESGIKPSMLTAVDMVSFIASLKYQIKPNIVINIKCGDGCTGTITETISLTKILSNCREIKFKQFVVENGDYKFLLTMPSWFDIMILRESINKMEDQSFSKANLGTYFALNKICLHILRIWMGGMEITTDDQQGPFNKLPVPERLSLFDSLSPLVTVDTQNEKSLIRIIDKHFDELKMQEQIFADSCSCVPCPVCGRKVEGGLSYDSFFVL